METVLIAIIVFLALALVWAYRKGFKDGFSIGNMKEKVTPAAIECALEKPKKKRPPADEAALKERRKTEAILQNMNVYNPYTETHGGQIDVE